MSATPQILKSQAGEPVAAAVASAGRREAWGWRLPRPVVVTLVAVVGSIAVLLAGAGLVASRGGRYEVPGAAVAPPEASAEASHTALRQQLAARLAALHPRGVWVLIDTHGNRLQIYRDGELLREAVCSTGSGTVLRDPRTGRLWVFETPLGERRVERKVRNPVWSKPDWAFIEEGYLPPRDASERVDTVSLGDYALYLGGGYLIHGTLFQTLLGRRVTHGCIRLGDEDLAYVYRTVPLGARVFLY